MIYIIADDLTGATDTGAQFAKRGYTTRLAIMPETGNIPTLSLQDTEVFVIDTETREVDSVTAQTRIKAVVERLPVTERDIVYKKIDSTLRGNIGVELTECLDSVKRDMCILTPSFPQNNRVTLNANLIIDARPLGFTEYYTGDLSPDKASHIPTFLEQTTSLPIGQIHLQDMIPGESAILKKIQDLAQAGKKIIVADAIGDDNLREILLASFEFEGTVLYCGSAGLANALAEVYAPFSLSPNAAALTDVVRISAPILVVSGSRRTIAQRQIEYLKSSMDVFDLNLTLEWIFSDRDRYLAQCVTEAIRAIWSGYHTVIRPAPLYQDEQVIHNMLVKRDLDLRELEVAIKEFLKELTAKIIDNSDVRTIILTGGDTAIGVCSALGIDTLNIVDELLPGISLCIGRRKERRDVNIITKAGGFGEEETLDRIIQKCLK